MKHIFLLILLLASQSWGFGDTNITSWRGLNFMVSSGYSHTCALDAIGVMCWGQYIDKPSYLKNRSKLIKQVSAGRNRTCVLTAEDVTCWRTTDGKFLQVPALTSPTQISTGDEVTCALSNEGAVCWTYPAWGQSLDGRFEIIDTSDIESPKQVSAAGNHFCILNAKEVFCGGINYNFPELPKFKSPTQVSAGIYHSCALDAEGVKCWGYNRFGQTDVPRLKKPLQVSAGRFYTCAIDSEGVKCWGGKDSRSEIAGLPDSSELNSLLKNIKNPLQVSVGSDNICVLSSEGVECFGGEWVLYKVPSLDFLDELKNAIPFLPPARAEYLKSIHGLVNRFSDQNQEAYYLLSLLAAPAILSTDSKYFVETFIPEFKTFIKRLEDNIGYSGDFRKVPDNVVSRNVAIEAIKSALSISLDYTSKDSQTRIQDALRSAGLGLSEPMDNQKVQMLIQQVDALTAEKANLRSSPKSAFLVDSLEIAANWLREKVK